jgi:hypothetical protein
VSRKTHSSGMFGSTFTVCVLPFKVNCIAMSDPRDKPYGERLKRTKHPHLTRLRHKRSLHSAARNINVVFGLILGVLSCSNRSGMFASRSHYLYRFRLP